MTNVIATAAAIATLFAGSAAFAEGGYVDEAGFINASAAPLQTTIEHQNDNATHRTVSTDERNMPGSAVTTVFVASTSAAEQSQVGR